MYFITSLIQESSKRALPTVIMMPIFFFPYLCLCVIFFTGATTYCEFVFLQPSIGLQPLRRTRFLDHTQRQTTVGRTPLGECSVRHRDLYLTTHNAHNRQTFMLPSGIRSHDRNRRGLYVIVLSNFNAIFQSIMFLVYIS